MNVLIVNMSDARGGAAIVARRLMHALNRQEGVHARMLVADRTTDDADVVALPRRWWIKKLLDRLVVWVANGFSRKGLWLADAGFFGTDITRRPEFQQADVIHLHWVNQGFLSLRDIDRILHSGKRVVWTMHDAWLTLPLHHHEGTPLPQSWLWRKLLPRVEQRKRQMLQNTPLQLVACSTWMAEAARQSTFTQHLPVTVIPNAIEIPVLPVKTPTEEHTILFAAARIDDEIKGFDDLLLALQHLRHRRDVRLLLAGGINDKRLLEQIPIPYEYLGYQSDMLARIAQATCLVSCSRRETLPTTIVEAQSVGTTPVAYCDSGARDLIAEGETGYFATYRDTQSLAQAIERAIDQPLDPEKLRQHVRANYSPEVIAQRHLQVYNAQTQQQ